MNTIRVLFIAFIVFYAQIVLSVMLLRLHHLGHCSGFDEQLYDENDTPNQHHQRGSNPWNTVKKLAEGQNASEFVRSNVHIPAMPHEEEWLLSSEPISYNQTAYFRQHGRFIPRILHKVRLLNSVCVVLLLITILSPSKR